MLVPHELAKGEQASGVSRNGEPLSWVRLPFDDPNDEPKPEPVEQDQASNSN